VLALLYAVPSGISALQFTRWHLTHHAELGDAVADPKRHHLSPKINRAWFKLLYFTPALFPIYFRAPAPDRSYPPAPTADRVGRQATILLHLAIMGALLAGRVRMLARHLVPFFLVPDRIRLNLRVNTTPSSRRTRPMRTVMALALVGLRASARPTWSITTSAVLPNLRRLRCPAAVLRFDRLAPVTYAGLFRLWIFKGATPPRTGRLGTQVEAQETLSYPCRRRARLRLSIRHLGETALPERRKSSRRSPRREEGPRPPPRSIATSSRPTQRPFR
jgi:hypothetical protein